MSSCEGPHPSLWGQGWIASDYTGPHRCCLATYLRLHRMGEHIDTSTRCRGDRNLTQKQGNAPAEETAWAAAHRVELSHGCNEVEMHTPGEVPGLQRSTSGVAPAQLRATLQGQASAGPSGGASRPPSDAGQSAARRVPPETSARRPRRAPLPRARRAEDTPQLVNRLEPLKCATSEAALRGDPGRKCARRPDERAIERRSCAHAQASS